MTIRGALAAQFEKARRLAILQALEFNGDGPDRKMNLLALRTQVQGVGLKAPLSAVRDDVAWLEEQGLVGQTDLPPFKIVHLTERGLDVAQGSEVVSGVARPGPGNAL